MSDIIGVRNNSTIVPYVGATKRTKQLDITVSCLQTGWSTVRAKAIFYADSSGVWRMRFNIAGSYNLASITGLTIAVTGVTFLNVSGCFQACSGFIGATSQGVRSYVTANTGNIILEIVSASTATTAAVSGDVELNAQPTTYTTAANMEGVTAVEVYIAPASGGSSGLINYYQEDDTTLTSVAWKPNGAASTIGTAFSVKITRVGRIVTLQFATSGTADPAGTTTTLELRTSADAAIVLPIWARPVATFATIAIIIDNAQTIAGELDISTAGTINIYKIASAAFTNGTDKAGLYNTSVSYAV